LGEKSEAVQEQYQCQNCGGNQVTVQMLSQHVDDVQLRNKNDGDRRKKQNDCCDGVPGEPGNRPIQQPQAFPEVDTIVDFSFDWIQAVFHLPYSTVVTSRASKYFYGCCYGESEM